MTSQSQSTALTWIALLGYALLCGLLWAMR